jgi:hypothetical protein
MDDLKAWILQNLYKDNKIIHGRMKRWSTSSPYWVEKHYPVFFDRITRSPGRLFSEQVYLIINDMSSIPTCGADGCNNFVDFKTYDKGHYTYCSTTCCNRDVDLLKVKIDNKRESGGFIRASQSIRNTALLRYGVDWPTRTSDCKEKRIQTNLIKFGVDNQSKLQLVKDKQVTTNLIRYGVEHPLQQQELHDKALRNGLGRSKVKWYNSDLWYQGMWEFSFLVEQYKITNNIRRGPRLFYKSISGSNKVYSPDFIVDDTRCYEIKSGWTWDNYGADKKLRVTNKLKLRAAKRLGYVVFLVIDGIHLSYSQLIKLRSWDNERGNAEILGYTRKC